MHVAIGVICFLALICFMIAVLYFTLKRNSIAIRSSKYILNRFELDNSVPTLTEMIEFHKNNDELSKYNIY